MAKVRPLGTGLERTPVHLRKKGKYKKFDRVGQYDMLEILETAWQCPRGTLNLYLEKLGMNNVKLFKWRQKWGQHGEKLRELLTTKKG